MGVRACRFVVESFQGPQIPEILKAIDSIRWPDEEPNSGREDRLPKFKSGRS